MFPYEQPQDDSVSVLTFECISVSTGAGWLGADRGVDAALLRGEGPVAVHRGPRRGLLAVPLRG